MADPLPILDAHVHFWDPRTTPREASAAVRLLGFSPWLLERVVRIAMPKPLVDFVAKAEYALGSWLPEDLWADAGQHADRLTGVVHIQAGWKGKSHADLVGETRWLESIDPKAEHLRAIVGAAHLEASDLGAVLDAHAAASPRFRGIRDMLARHPEASVFDFARETASMARDDWREGYAELGRRGLSFDAWVYHHQLEDLAEVAEAIPDTKVVLCHLGTPVAVAGEYGGLGRTERERARIEDEWRAGLARIAEVPHLHFKLSGMLMPILGFGAERREPMSQTELVDRVGPFLEHALETVGAERCMFGSNFPIDKVSIDLATLVAGFDELLAGRPEPERRAVLAENAAAFYQTEER